MGGDGHNQIMGTEGKDCIDGEKGNDTISGGGEGDHITGGAGNDTLYGGAGDDTLMGEAGDDTLMGEAGSDELIGGAGDNTLDGGEDEDGSDQDIVIYKDSIRVKVSLKDGTATNITMPTDADNSFTLGGGVDKLIGIENVKGSHGNDIIDGDDNANLLKGLDGADTINGHGGDDTIIPNRPEPPAAGSDETVMDGSDTVNGGEGVDTISYQGEAEDVMVTVTLVPAEMDESNTTDVDEREVSTAIIGTVIDYITTVEEGQGADAMRVSTIENIVGGPGEDTLTGDHRDNTLTGGGGGDTLNGEEDPEDAPMGGDDMLIGGLGVDTLNGGPGNDTLDGGAEGDTLNGNAGDDMIYATVDTDGRTNDIIDGGEPENDPATEDVDESTLDMDTVSYEKVEDADPGTTDVKEGVNVALDDNSENLTGSPNNDLGLTGNPHANVIMGLAGDDMLSGLGGVDTLNGGPGKDSLTGGDGADIFVVFSGESSGEMADTIIDYARDTVVEGEVTVKGDEIHLKNFSSQTAVVEIENDTNVTISVGGTVVLNVTAPDGEADDVRDDLRKEGKIKFVPTN